MSRRLCQILPVLLLAAPARARERTPAADPTAEQLGARAVAASPDLKAVEARISALQQQVRAAGAWLDPVASFEYSNMPIDAWAPGEHPMSGLQFQLKQTFPFPGKTARREAVAEGLVREQRAALAEKKVQLRALVEQAFYRLALVRQLRRVTEQHINLVAQFIDVVRVKYEVGRARQEDLIRLQVLAKKLRDDLGDFDTNARALRAAINASLSRPVKTAVDTPPGLAALPAPARSEALARAAATHRPLLHKQREEARTRELAARRAARELYPDITAWVGYRIRLSSGADPGTDFVGLGLSLPLPLLSDRRWDGERQQNRALARAAEAQRQATLDRIRGELERIVSDWQRAAQRAKVYREQLVPLAHRALDATFASYQVDRADFASLYQAELQLLHFERTILRATAQTHLSRARVLALVGQRGEE